VDGVEGKPPLRLYQSRFELQREALAQGREAFIRWYCDRLSSILDTQIAAKREIYIFIGEWRCYRE